MLLIGLAGPSCVGKVELAKYLTANYQTSRSNGLDVGTFPEGDEGIATSDQPATTIWLYKQDSLTNQKDDITNVQFKVHHGESYKRLGFHSAHDVLEHVMGNWGEGILYLIPQLDEFHDWHVLRKRPFFLLIAVEAPISLTYERYLARAGASEGDTSLESFLRRNDARLTGSAWAKDHTTKLADRVQFISLDINHARSLAQVGGMVGSVNAADGKSTKISHHHHSSSETKHSLYHMMHVADLHILNDFQIIDAFHALLDDLDLFNLERIRPSWDTYFMRLCELASSRSNCMKRRVGCIIVKDRRVIASGYNGTPRGVLNCNQGGCPRCNGNASCGVGLDVCLCLHAEENALLEAGRDRIGSYPETILYCNTHPCLSCSKKIVQLGISEVVYGKSYGGMDSAAVRLLTAGGVRIRQHLVESHFY